MDKEHYFLCVMHWVILLGYFAMGPHFAYSEQDLVHLPDHRAKHTCNVHDIIFFCHF